MLKLENGTNAFYQWDLEQRFIVTEIDGPASVHFWQEGLTEALVVSPYKEGDRIMADVPNILLQKAAPISAYIYREDVGKYTSYKWIFQVIPREKPADYVYTETERKTWEELDKRIKGLEGKPAPTVEQKYNPSSENPQSGKAVAEAVKGYVKAEDVTATIKATTDQTYTPSSTNAQSGKAVAEAFNKQELKHIKTITLTEAVTKITTYFDKPLKEFYIRFIGNLDITANVSDAVLCARTNEGSQYFCWTPYLKFTPTEIKAFFIHAKEIIPRQWESEFPKETITVTKNAYGYRMQGISSSSADVRKSFSSRLEGHLTSRYVEHLDFFISNDAYSFAVDSKVEIYGVEVDE